MDALKSNFEAISAKYNGEPCMIYLGPRSAGNYVNNDSQWDRIRDDGQLSHDELPPTFTNWNNGRLQSFLVQITSEIFAQKIWRAYYFIFYQYDQS